MFKTAAMHKLRVYVLERDVRQATRALGELGVMHLQNSVEESGGELQPEKLDNEVRRCRGLLERLRRLMGRLEVPLPESLAAGTGADVGQVEQLMGSLEAAVAGHLEELAKLERAMAGVEDVLRDLTPYRDVKVPLNRLVESGFLSVKACAVPAPEMESLRSVMPDGVLLTPLSGAEPVDQKALAEVLVVSSRRTRFAMQTALEEHGLQEKPIPAYEAGSPRDVYENVVAQRLDLAGRLAVLRQQLRAVGAQNAGRLKDAWADLEIQLKLYEAQQNFGTTWATAVISGWVLARNVERVRATLRQVAGGQCIFQVADPSREDIEHGRVPSYVQHSKLLAPFETLVKAYGVASYTEIEPTLLFTVSFLLMFGIIFGDLGQGLCLAAIGLIVRRRARTKEARDIGWVIVAAGAASMLFGAFLQGSFFGMSLKDAGFRLTLGFEPIRFDGRGQENVFRYLVLAFVLGVVIISLGAILNIVNRLRAGDYAEGLLGRFGLVGIIFYWGALGLAIKQLLVGPGSTDAWLALLLLGLPLLVLALHEPLWALLTGRRPLWQEGAGVGIFQGLIEAMETGTVYVANTFSFLRVAAFALSHAALCFVIFIVQGLVNGLPAGPLWSAAVFVVGTALIIGLEGLIVTIQILRLEYYEFFTKFFDGEGLPYRPFRLR